MRRRPNLVLIFLVFLASGFSVGAVGLTTAAQEGASAEQPIGPDPELYRETVSEAITFLRSSQAEDGSYSAQAGPGVTALVATGENVITDSEGQEHDWRRELAEKLAAEQHANGSCTNANSRWLEGDPNLVTGYALLALSYCRPPGAAR